MSGNEQNFKNKSFLSSFLRLEKKKEATKNVIVVLVCDWQLRISHYLVGEATVHEVPEVLDLRIQSRLWFRDLIW